MVLEYPIFGCAAILFISALMIVYRTAKGPTVLDRMVSVDMFTSILIGGFALLAAAARRADLLPVFVVLAIIGFIGSTALARFSVPLAPAVRKAISDAAAGHAAGRAADDTADRKVQDEKDADNAMLQKISDQNPMPAANQNPNWDESGGKQ
ncbi:monovalent cation/H+ antiporter complex subunit F [Arcanobacterium hippocoleae]